MQRIQHNSTWLMDGFSFYVETSIQSIDNQERFLCFSSICQSSHDLRIRWFTLLCCKLMWKGTRRNLVKLFELFSRKKRTREQTSPSFVVSGLVQKVVVNSCDFIFGSFLRQHKSWWKGNKVIIVFGQQTNKQTNTFTIDIQQQLSLGLQTKSKIISRECSKWKIVLLKRRREKKTLRNEVPFLRLDLCV